MSDQNVFYVPYTTIVHGQIVEYRDSGNYYLVKISHPYPTMGALACSLIYQHGGKVNYKVGDRVSVLATMQFGGVEMKNQGYLFGAKHYILGLLDKLVMFPLDQGKPFYKNDQDYAYLNRTNDAGLLATDDGMVMLTTRGAVKTVLKPFGHGIYENMKQDTYQNYHRIISHNDPYLAKEYFGLFKGKDQDDKMTRLTPDSSLMCYKRFVTQTMDPSSFVSSCEGSWNPWVGPNNNIDEIKKGSGILYTKIINSGASAISKRLTIEAGEEGKTFYNFRIDNMIYGERSMPVGGGCTPAVVGNKFKLAIADDGSVEVRAASKGIPLTNLAGFTLKIDADGNLTINSKGKISISHGDTDAETCSITLDGAGAIDIKALGGLKVNGEALVSATFIKFWLDHAADLYLSSAPGSPSPINPAVLPLAMKAGNVTATMDPKVGGFCSVGLPAVPPILGTQLDTDSHTTTA